MGLDDATSSLPQPWGKIAGWLLTLAIAAALVLVFEAEVAKPYRVPTASMEPTLHCGRPTDGCKGSTDDRVVANRLAYRFRGPRRGEIVVFRAPAAAARECQGTGVFVKRLIGLPSDVVSERNGIVSVNGKPLAEPYVLP